MDILTSITSRFLPPPAPSASPFRLPSTRQRVNLVAVSSSSVQGPHAPAAAIARVRRHGLPRFDGGWRSCSGPHLFVLHWSRSFVAPVPVLNTFLLACLLEHRPLSHITITYDTAVQLSIEGNCKRRRRGAELPSHCRAAEPLPSSSTIRRLTACTDGYDH